VLVKCQIHPHLIFEFEVLLTLWFCYSGKNHGPAADAKQRGHNGVVGPRRQRPRTDTPGQPCRWSPSRTRRREKRQGNSLVPLAPRSLRNKRQQTKVRIPPPSSRFPQIHPLPRRGAVDFRPQISRVVAVGQPPTGWFREIRRGFVAVRLGVRAQRFVVRFSLVALPFLGAGLGFELVGYRLMLDFCL
jgi:hypothetical protein